MTNDEFERDRKKMEQDCKMVGEDIYQALYDLERKIDKKIKRDSGRTSIRRKVKRETFLSSLKDGFDSIIDGLKTFKFW